MQSLRHHRVRELLKREVGAVLRREIPADEAGLITVSDVGLAGDLKSATIYLGVIGGTAQQKKALALVNEHRPHLQRLVGRAVVLKYTPKLHFELDASLERGNRVLEILDDIERTAPPA